jgi:hypothetical protein
MNREESKASSETLGLETSREELCLAGLLETGSRILVYFREKDFKQFQVPLLQAQEESSASRVDTLIS